MVSRINNYNIIYLFNYLQDSPCTAGASHKRIDSTDGIPKQNRKNQTHTRANRCYKLNEVYKDEFVMQRAESARLVASDTN